jgi:hypothetical protein
MAADLDQKNLVTRLMKYKRLINIPSVCKLLAITLVGTDRFRIVHQHSHQPPPRRRLDG